MSLLKAKTVKICGVRKRETRTRAVRREVVTERRVAKRILRELADECTCGALCHVRD